MLKATREDGTEVSMRPFAKWVVTFGVILALAVIVVFSVGIGGLIATTTM